MEEEEAGFDETGDVVVGGDPPCVAEVVAVVVVVSCNHHREVVADTNPLNVMRFVSIAKQEMKGGRRRL